jgi:predicted enzyme related to lactoylglutathione lyase
MIRLKKRHHIAIICSDYEKSKAFYTNVLGFEIKTSIICSGSAIARFNFIGNSIIGNRVNLEAGSIIANHYNEREDKTISIVHNSQKINTCVTKFGAWNEEDTKWYFSVVDVFGILWGQLRRNEALFDGVKNRIIMSKENIANFAASLLFSISICF